MCVHGKSWKSTALRYFKLRCIRVWIRAPVPSSTVQLCKTNLLFSLFQWQSKGALNKSCFYSIWWQKRCTRNALAQRDLEHSMSSSVSKASPPKNNISLMHFWPSIIRDQSCKNPLSTLLCIWVISINPNSWISGNQSDTFLCFLLAFFSHIFGGQTLIFCWQSVFCKL